MSHHGFIITGPRLACLRGLHHAGKRGQIDVVNESVSVQYQSPADMTAALLAVRDRRDREAFGHLFDHFAPRLKAMMIRGGLPAGAADDVVQDVMLSVWRKAGQFDPHRAEASAWIYRIARNRQIDLARRQPQPQIEMLDPSSAPVDPAQLLALREEAGLLRTALNRLNPEQNMAIQQAYMDDLPQSEISRQTGLPLGTIKSRIRLGLERLRHELKDLRR